MPEHWKAVGQILIGCGERPREPKGRKSWNARLAGTLAPAERFTRSLLERETERKVECARGIAMTGVEIMSVFEADRPNDRLPIESPAGRVEDGVEGIMLNAVSFTESIGKKNQRPLGSERLFELHAAQSERFRADNVAGLIFRRGFALLITADGSRASGKKAFVERKIIAGAAEGDCGALC
jgi:hypothetical protein